MSDKVDQLLARVQYLEDLEAIRHTWRDYCIRLDSADFDGLSDVYTEDGVLEMAGLDALLPGIDGEYRGRRRIIDDFYKPAVAGATDITAGLFSTGHISTNMQIDHLGDEATTLAYFFEIVANNTVLIGTYQHRLRREPDRWRFKFLRISVRYHAQLEATDIGGCSLKEVLAKPV
ncbi:MAG: nuclear transport factor 2 family protein [Gammaproteobacteria bacterium]|nr:nuclear transport factor 2 family protein [Gammaproteobacteria bacterium]